MASFTEYCCPLLLYPVVVFLNPILPSLNTEFKYTSGYEFKSSPSALTGIELYTLEIEKDDSGFNFILFSSLIKVSLAFSISTYSVSVFTISYPFTYALPVPKPATIRAVASSIDLPLTKLVLESKGYVPLLSPLK